MTDTSVPQPAQPANEVYGIFAGPIDQAAVARIGNAIAITTSNKVTHVHMVFQTSGGTIPDGIAIYNIFRALPIPLTIYNIGTISSAGVVAYLGGRTRVVSRHGTFMIHKSTSPALGVTSERLKSMAESLAIDDDRLEAIFAAENLTLTKKQKQVHRLSDLWLSADEAIKVGVANSVKEFSPPKGTQLFFLGPT
jgi:ATP-dependent Clp protease, protease subunit